MRAEFVTSLAALPARFSIREIHSARQVQGLLLCGELQVGDAIMLMPTGTQTVVTALQVEDDTTQRIQAPALATLSVAHDIAAVPGDIVAPLAELPTVADQFVATLHWLGEKALIPGRHYQLLAGHRSVSARVSKLHYRISRTGTEQIASNSLARGESGSCTLVLQGPVAFDLAGQNSVTARFELVQKGTTATVARGEITQLVPHAADVQLHATTITRKQRADAKQQRPRLIWLTGLPGSGKSTLANLLEVQLHAQARHTILLDGSNLRLGLNSDLGFSEADRVENIRRVAEVARLMLDAGLIVIASFVSPLQAERDMVRALFAPGEYVEVFVDTPLELCAQRDQKGLYERARQHQLRDVTGVNSAFEVPNRAELRLDTGTLTAAEACRQILDYLELE